MTARITACEAMQIARIFDAITPLDIVGPIEVLARVPGAETAKGMQLSIEYDPPPPFDCGAPSKASPALLDRVRQGMPRAPASER